MFLISPKELTLIRRLKDVEKNTERKTCHNNNYALMDTVLLSGVFQNHLKLTQTCSFYVMVVAKKKKKRLSSLIV